MSSNDVTARAHGKDDVLTSPLLQVVAATHHASKELVAVKMVSKKLLIKDDPDSVLIERKVLEMVECSPYCTHLYGAFQTDVSVFSGKYNI